MKKFKRRLNLSMIIAAGLLFSIASGMMVKARYTPGNFNELNLSRVDSIMVVAHPDDEILWGGSHLLDGNYLVVCITAGSNPVRAEELQKAVSVTNDQCVMLGYPDKVLNKRSDWKNVKEDIVKDLKKLLSMKKWKVIVTHNAKGEYGHNQHIMTHQIVTDIYEENYAANDNLYYFGDYYKKSELPSVSNALQKIDEDNCEIKLDVIKNIYTSQDFLMKKFGHMVPYENWKQYIKSK